MHSRLAMRIMTHSRAVLGTHAQLQSINKPAAAVYMASTRCLAPWAAGLLPHAAIGRVGFASGMARLSALHARRPKSESHTQDHEYHGPNHAVSPFDPANYDQKHAPPAPPPFLASGSDADSAHLHALAHGHLPKHALDHDALEKAAATRTGLGLHTTPPCAGPTVPRMAPIRDVCLEFTSITSVPHAYAHAAGATRSHATAAGGGGAREGNMDDRSGPTQVNEASAGPTQTAGASGTNNTRTSSTGGGGGGGAGAGFDYGGTAYPKGDPRESHMPQPTSDYQVSGGGLDSSEGVSSDMREGRPVGGQTHAAADTTTPVNDTRRTADQDRPMGGEEDGRTGGTNGDADSSRVLNDDVNVGVMEGTAGIGYGVDRDMGEAEGGSGGGMRVQEGGSGGRVRDPQMFGGEVGSLPPAMQRTARNGDDDASTPEPIPPLAS